MKADCIGTDMFIKKDLRTYMMATTLYNGKIGMAKRKIVESSCVDTMLLTGPNLRESSGAIRYDAAMRPFVITNIGPSSLPPTPNLK